jgi:nucleoside-diphosphate-sugar epimerase
VVFHLAALLSTRAEFIPETVHAVNVQGTLNLLGLAVEEARSLGRPIPFLFPSSIAVYGLPDLVTKRAAGRVAEDEWLSAITMYSCTKLACALSARWLLRDREAHIERRGGGLSAASRYGGAPGRLQDRAPRRRPRGLLRELCSAVGEAATAARHCLTRASRLSTRRRCP